MKHATAYFVETIEAGFEGSLGRAQRIVVGLIEGFMQEDRFDDGTD